MEFKRTDPNLAWGAYREKTQAGRSCEFCYNQKISMRPIKMQNGTADGKVDFIFDCDKVGQNLAINMTLP